MIMEKKEQMRTQQAMGAVITAVGIGEREGAKKALQEIQGMTVVERVVVNFQRAGVKDLVIVMENQEEELKKRLKGFGVTFLRKEDQENLEMFDAVKLGLSYLQSRCKKIFVCPVDVPFFTADTVRILLETEGNVVIPSYNHHGGHPVLLDQAVFTEIIQYEGSDGLRGAIRSLDRKPSYVSIEDVGTIKPVKQESLDLELMEAHHRNLNRAQVKLRLIHTKPYFGPGTVTLLRQIQRLGAVREASEKTGISYSKAWNMIRTAESESGMELVRRQPGGKYGGTAELTEEGMELIRKFEMLEQSVEQFAEQEFQQIFGENFFKTTEKEKVN